MRNKKEKFKLTQEYLKECLDYDPDTGIFTWRARPVWHFEDGVRLSAKGICNIWNSKYQNKPITCKTHGYIIIRINNKPYRAHRLAFLYVEGYFPEHNVDHINRIRDDNRWCNLRHVTQVCNMQNCEIRSDNTSGITGISWNNKKKAWVSQISINKKNKNLGRFKNYNDAVMARYQEELNNPLWTCSVESSAYKYLKENNLI